MRVEYSTMLFSLFLVEFNEFLNDKKRLTLY